jgi:CRP-like cAMP-binding protein
MTAEVFRSTLAHDLGARSQLLEQLALFRELSQTELDLLVQRLVPMTLDPGAALSRESAAHGRLYIVESGTVQVERDGVVIATFSSGEAFGDNDLARNVPPNAKVRAVTATQLFALNADDLGELASGAWTRRVEPVALSRQHLRPHLGLHHAAAGIEHWTHGLVRATRAAG